MPPYSDLTLTAVGPEVTSAVQDCQCANNWVHLRMRVRSLKLFPTFEPLESLGIDILGPLLKSTRGIQHIIVVSDRFSKLTLLVTLKRLCMVDVAPAILAHWVYKYETPKI